MVAPIDEVANEEMEVDDDGEGAGDARAEPRADEPGDDPPPPRPREVRPSPIRPGAEAVRQHNLTHCPYQSWCEVCVASKGKSDFYHREATQPMDGDVARIQMDFMFVCAEGTFVDEPRAKATVLMVICKDDGNLSATEVRAKTDEYGVEMVLQHCRDLSESASSTRQNNDSGTDECWRTPRDWSGRTCERKRAGPVASVLPGCARAHESWSHSRPVWTVVRYQSDQRTKQTPYESTRGFWYESALVPLERWSWRRLQTLIGQCLGKSGLCRPGGQI